MGRLAVIGVREGKKGTAAGRPHSRSMSPEGGQPCPYLDTVNRHMLDFDFEKVCSVTVSNLNVYACLVCGKYFQGRGVTSPAYYHALHEDHHVFIHLHSLKVDILGHLPCPRLMHPLLRRTACPIIMK